MLDCGFSGADDRMYTNSSSTDLALVRCLMGEDSSLELERDKLALERERLSLDREIFSADAAKRSAEVEKLLAERDQQIADKTKTDLESEDMKKKWFKRPAIMTSLSLPAVVVGLLTAYLGYMGTLSTQQHEIKEERLTTRVDNLTAEESAAEKNLKEASRQYDDLVGKKKTLQQDNEALIAQRKALATAVELGNLKEYIRLLTKDLPDSLIASNRYVGEIVTEVNGDTNGNKHEFLRHAADDTSSRLEIRALLYEALLDSTHDAQYARMISRLSDNADVKTFTTFGSLLKTDSFDVKDRSKLICSVYRHAAPETNNVSRRLDTLSKIVSYDPEAVVDCRDPFMALVILLRDSWAIDGIKQTRGIGYERLKSLYSICPEEAVISTIQVASKNESDYREFIRRNDGLAYGVIREVPTDAVGAVLNGSGAVLRQEWLAANEKLVSIWSEPDLATIRALPNPVFLQIFHGKWISIAGLQ